MVGLENYKQRLQDSNYRNITSINTINNPTYIFGNWQKENLTVTIIHSHANNPVPQLQSLITKPIDCIYSIFSVLGHIPKRDNRQNTIKALGELMSAEGEMIVNVSTETSLPNEVTTYEMLRKQLAIAEAHKLTQVISALRASIRLAQEKGDLYYSKANDLHATHSYGHVYNKAELVEDIKIAGLSVNEVGIMSIEQPYTLSHNNFKKYQDYLFSAFLSYDLPFYPFNVSDKIAKNIFIAANKQ